MTLFIQLNKVSQRGRHMKALLLWLFCAFTVFSSAQSIDQLLDSAWENYENSPQEALELVDQAILLSRKQKNEALELEALEMKGILFDELGYDNKAIDLYIEVLERRQKAGERELLISLYLNLGILYQRLNQIDEAESYFDQALILAKEFNDHEGAFFAENNLGTIYSQQKNFNKALALFRNQLTQLEQSGNTDPLGIGTVYSNIGVAFDRSQKYDSARWNYNKSLSILKGENNIQYAIVLNSLGKMEAKLGNLEEGEKHIKESETYSRKLNISQLLLKNVVSLAQINNEKGKFKEAAQYYQEAAALTDSLKERNSSKYINTLKTVYEVDKKERQIDQLAIAKKEQEQTISWLIIFAALVFVLLAMSIVWYRTRLLKKKREQEIH
ncbi:MAG: tetratricopeptide repeat protein, partial [Flavobacteriales bacterium]